MATPKKKLVLSKNSSTVEVPLHIVGRSARDQREMDYQAWLGKVDRIFTACFGFSMNELEDSDSRSSFEEGVSAAEYARDFISDYRYDNGLMSDAEMFGDGEED